MPKRVCDPMKNAEYAHHGVRREPWGRLSTAAEEANNLPATRFGRPPCGQPALVYPQQKWVPEPWRRPGAATDILRRGLAESEELDAQEDHRRRGRQRGSPPGPTAGGRR